MPHTGLSRSAFWPLPPLGEGWDGGRCGALFQDSFHG